MKIARNAELFADEYALELTKSLETGISALQKRESFYKQLNPQTSKFIEFFRSFFKAHPSENDRIKNLMSKSSICNKRLSP